MSAKHKFVALFPYLFVDCRPGLEIDGITVKPSSKEVLETEREDIRSLLITVVPFFRLREDEPISYWSYATDEACSETEFWQKIVRLRKISDTLRFTKVSDLSNTTPYSTFDFWIFQLGSQAADREYSYFESLRNGISSFGFHVMRGEYKDRFQPSENVSPQLLTAQELERNRYFKALYLGWTFLREEENQRQRISRGIEWFNRSFVHSGHGIDTSEAIVNMHTALEALLRPDHDERNVKAQIKTALLTLLGHRPELSRWFDSFYELRNSIVHGDVEPSSFTYIHHLSKSKTGNRHHLSLAREVFLGCLDMMLETAEKFPLLGFEERLVPNEFRIERMLRALRRGQKKHWTELVRDKEFSKTSHLRTDDRSSPKKIAVEVTFLLLPHIRSELEESNEGGVNNAAIQELERIEKSAETDFGRFAVALSDFEKEYRQHYFVQDKNTDQLIFRGIVYSFLDYASWRLLVFYD